MQEGESKAQYYRLVFFHALTHPQVVLTWAFQIFRCCSVKTQQNYTKTVLYFTQKLQADIFSTPKVGTMLQDSALQGSGMVKKKALKFQWEMLNFLQKKNQIVAAICCCECITALPRQAFKVSSCRKAPFARILTRTPCRDTVCNQAVGVNHRNQRIPEQIERTEFNSWAQLAADCAELHGAGMEGSLTSERANKQGLKEGGKRKESGFPLLF